MKDASFNQTKIKVKWPSGKKRMQKKRCNFKGAGHIRDLKQSGRQPIRGC